MHGNYEKALPQKIIWQLLHLGAVIATGWLLFGSGFSIFNDWFGTSLTTGDITRNILLISCSLIAFARMFITSFVLIKRTMPWSEVVTVGIWVWIVHLGFAFGGGLNDSSIGVVDVVGIVLFLIGSYLNTGSEVMRHLWKKKPETQGKIYTEGLFKYSMHINYLGDSVWSIGWALIAGSIWVWLIPVVMTLGFIFGHIPTLDKYLKEKYSEQFEDYAKRVKKFVPWVY